MIRGVESVFGMGGFRSVRRCEPVGGSKVLSTFVRQIDRCGTASALCADIAPTLAVPVRSIVRWAACQKKGVRHPVTFSCIQLP